MTAPDRTFTDDQGRDWEWCGGEPGALGHGGLPILETQPMTNVRIAEAHEAFIYLEHFPDMGVPEEIWTNPGAYGDSRRKRLKPRSISVTWRRHNGEPWEISWLNVHANYQRKGSENTGMSVLYVGGPRGQQREIEPWIVDLIALAHPERQAVPA